MLLYQFVRSCRCFCVCSSIIVVVDVSHLMPNFLILSIRFCLLFARTIFRLYAVFDVASLLQCCFPQIHTHTDTHVYSSIRTQASRHQPKQYSIESKKKREERKTASNRENATDAISPMHSYRISLISRKHTRSPPA